MMNSLPRLEVTTFDSIPNMLAFVSANTALKMLKIFQCEKLHNWRKFSRKISRNLFNIYINAIRFQADFAGVATVKMVFIVRL